MINFNYFDKIFCVNMKHRTDRWELSKKEFEKVGILERVERFDAVADSENPKKGFYESHMRIVKLAYEQKLNNVLIFEDDVAFYKNMCTDKLNKSLDALTKSDWEFYYMGGVREEYDHDLNTKDLLRNGKVNTMIQLIIYGSVNLLVGLNRMQ